MAIPHHSAQAFTCEVRRALAADFATKARLYGEAVVRLTSKGAADPAKYDTLRKQARDAGKEAELAQMQFEEHVEQHGCTA